jgi:hypothetical protein
MMAASCAALAMYYHDALDHKQIERLTGYPLYSLRRIITNIHNLAQVVHENDFYRVVLMRYDDVLEDVGDELYISWDQPLPIVNKYFDVLVFCTEE